MFDTDKYFDTPLETHQVQTEDGYLLTLKRVPGCPAVIPRVHGISKTEDGLENETLIPKPAVLILHGLHCCGADWMLNSPEKTLPHKLHMEGYDCWIGSKRGTQLSRGHVTLTPKSRKYWDFSCDEIGEFDIPAMIDYILQETGNTKLYYVGHSLGSTDIFITMNVKPEYNSKIEMMVALCPAVYGHHSPKFLIKSGSPIGALLGKNKTFYRRAGEVCPKTASGYGKRFCLPFKNPDTLGIWMMKKCGKLAGAFGTEQIEKERLLMLSQHLPGPSSMKTCCHVAQCMDSKTFQPYDYGQSGNQKKYGKPKPPPYDLKKVTFPVATITSEYDKLISPKDVAQVAKELPNLIEHHEIRIQNSRFNHADFMFGGNADTLVYDKIIDIFSKSMNFSTKL